jgi:hypothetical protein
MNFKGFTSRVHLTNSGTIIKKFHEQYKWMAFRESIFLKRLELYSNFPKLVREGSDLVEMSFAGNRCNKLSDYAYQKDFIIGPLKEQRILHRDIKPFNLLVLGDKLMCIDFSWSIFEHELDNPEVKTHPMLGNKHYPDKDKGIWDDSKAFDIAVS